LSYRALSANYGSFQIGFMQKVGACVFAIHLMPQPDRSQQKKTHSKINLWCKQKSPEGALLLSPGLGRTAAQPRAETTIEKGVGACFCFSKTVTTPWCSKSGADPSPATILFLGFSNDKLYKRLPAWINKALSARNRRISIIGDIGNTQTVTVFL